MPGDPLWSNVALLLTFDTDNSDASGAARTPTNHSTTINATNYQFGGGALDTTTANSYVSYAPAISLGTTQFCIECWARITGTWPGGSSVYPFLTQWGTTNNWFFGYDNNGGSGLAFYTNGSNFGQHVGGVNPADNNFHHYCVERDASNTLRLYIDGVVKYSTSSFTVNIGATDTLIVGHQSSGGSSWPGQIDEVRITVGATRYGGAFTPAAAAFPIGPLPPPPTPPPITRYLNALAFEVDPDLDVIHPLSLFAKRSAITIQPTSTSHARAAAVVAEVVAQNPSPPMAASMVLVEVVALVAKPTAWTPALRVRLAWDEFTDQDDPIRRNPYGRLSIVPPPPPPLAAAAPMLRLLLGREDEDEAANPLLRSLARHPAPLFGGVADFAICVIT